MIMAIQEDACHGGFSMHVVAENPYEYIDPESSPRAAGGGDVVGY